MNTEAESKPATPLPDRDLARIAETMRILTSPRRLRLLEALEAGEAGSGPLLDALGRASRATMVAGLAQLRRSGAIEAERRGPTTTYSITPKGSILLGFARRAASL